MGHAVTGAQATNLKTEPETVDKKHFDVLIGKKTPEEALKKKSDDLPLELKLRFNYQAAPSTLGQVCTAFFGVSICSSAPTRPGNLQKKQSHLTALLPYTTCVRHEPCQTSLTHHLVYIVSYVHLVCKVLSISRLSYFDFKLFKGLNPRFCLPASIHMQPLS